MALAPELLAILVCPESKAPLIYFAQGESGADPGLAFLFCPTSRLRFGIDDDLPNLLVDDATRLPPADAARLVARARELGLTT